MQLAADVGRWLKRSFHACMSRPWSRWSRVLSSLAGRNLTWEQLDALQRHLAAEALSCLGRHGFEDPSAGR